jgi:neutral ceramidase
MKRYAVACGLILGCGFIVSAVRPAGSLAAPGLKIGVASTTITPFLDIPLQGYYYPRMPDGVHDDLHAKALVIDDGQDQVVLVACDLVEVSREAVEAARRQISARCGIPADHVLISATHTHTGPEGVPSYVNNLGHWIADSVLTAEGIKRPALLSVATEQEPALAHNRRYLMKDGTVQTNPGFLNPNVVRAVGPIDARVSVLFAEDENHSPMVTWVNYAMHQDTVGGTRISADYAYYLARTLAAVKGPDMLTTFTIGAAGDINHWDVQRPGPQRGFETARKLGETLAGDVVKAYTHMQPLDSVRVKALSETITLQLAKVSEEEVKEAEKIVAQPPRTDVDFTLERVKAEKIMQVKKRGGEDLRAEVQVLTAGPVAFVAIPGEYFVELGMRIQKESPFPYTFIVELANDALGYIPTRRGFEEGGYEPTSTVLAPGSGEAIADKAIELLKRCK